MNYAIGHIYIRLYVYCYDIGSVRRFTAKSRHGGGVS